MSRLKVAVAIAITAVLFIYVACSNTGDSDGTAPPVGGGSQEEYYDVTVSWDKNVESLVNSLGGGYKVYYSENSGFSIDDSDISVKDVPLASGDFAPTSTTLSLTAGTWYIKIVAYFSLNEGASSLPAEQKSVTLP